jgi:hypothetical protein
VKSSRKNADNFVVIIMKKCLMLLLLVMTLTTTAAAKCDLTDSIEDWNSYYAYYKITGYPTYNQAMDRYDFYDIEKNYCGSLCYNPIVGGWEYFSL